MANDDLLRKEAECRSEFLSARNERQLAQDKCTHALIKLQDAKRELYAAGVTGNIMRDENGQRINTRPAATVEGLERLSMQYIGWEDKAVCIAPDEKGDYCLVTQAERIILNERLEVRKLSIEQVKWMKKALTLQADNAALTAQVKELTEDRDSWRRVSERLERDSVRQASEKEALETQLAAARKALKTIADAPAWGFPEKWETTPSEVRQLAREALEGRS